MSEQEFFSELYDSDFERVRDCALTQLKHAAAIERLLGATAHLPAPRVLSLGCGDGHLERIAAPRLGQIWGVDISEVGIAQATRRAEAAGLANTQFRCEDVTRMAPPEGGAFDAIWALGFLHHIRDEELDQVIAHSLSLLVPGGVMISTDPNARRLVALLTPLVRRTHEKYHSPDERELVPGDLAMRYEGAGFTMERVFYHDFFTGPLAWLWPSIPRPLAQVVWQSDRAIRLIGPLARLSSSFMVFARKPG